MISYVILSIHTLNLMRDWSFPLPEFDYSCMWSIWSPLIRRFRWTRILWETYASFKWMKGEHPFLPLSKDWSLTKRKYSLVCLDMSLSSWLPEAFPAPEWHALSADGNYCCHSRSNTIQFLENIILRLNISFQLLLYFFGFGNIFPLTNASLHSYFSASSSQHKKCYYYFFPSQYYYFFLFFFFSYFIFFMYSIVVIVLVIYFLCHSVVVIFILYLYGIPWRYCWLSSCHSRCIFLFLTGDVPQIHNQEEGEENATRWK